MRSSIQIREEENLELTVKYAAMAGFKEVAISFGSGEMCFGDNCEEGAYNIKKLLDDNGLVCKQIHLPAYHLLISSETTDEKTERAMENAFKAGSIIGAEWAAYHPRTTLDNGYDRNKSFEDNKKILSGYMEYAEKYNVGIAVENMPLYPYIHPEWRFFGGGWEELINILDYFNSNKMGICWDFGHAHTASLDQTAAIKNMGDRIKITHVHDNYRNGDHHQLPAMGSLEWGCVEWDKIMAALKEINYSGPLTLELIFPPLPMLKNYIGCCADCLEYLKSLAK